MAYKMVELKEGIEVQYVGVYVLRWQKEWGEPQVGFVEDDGDPDLVAQLLKALEEVVLRAKSSTVTTGMRDAVEQARAAIEAAREG